MKEDLNDRCKTIIVVLNPIALRKAKIVYTVLAFLSATVLIH